MRVLLLTLGLTACFLCAPAICRGEGGERSPFTAGFEAGTGTPVAMYHQYSYKLSIGYRNSGSEWSCPACFLAYGLFKLSYAFIPKLELSMLLGYEGLARGESALPLELRLSWYFAGKDVPGGFVFGGGGVAFPDDFASRITLLANIGGGYRFRLPGLLTLDVLLRAQAYTRYPDLYDPDTESIIPSDNVYVNRALVGSISAGLAINF